jgi:hypothetical protein
VFVFDRKVNFRLYKTKSAGNGGKGPYENLLRTIYGQRGREKEKERERERGKRERERERERKREKERER